MERKVPRAQTNLSPQAAGLSHMTGLALAYPPLQGRAIARANRNRNKSESLDEHIDQKALRFLICSCTCDSPACRGRVGMHCAKRDACRGVVCGEQGGWIGRG